MHYTQLADCNHRSQFEYIKESEHPDTAGLSWVRCLVCGQTELVHIPLLVSTNG